MNANRTEIETDAGQNPMRQDWDQRAKENALHYIDIWAGTEQEFRDSGIADSEMILSDVGQFLTPDAAVLEIGCGIGRLMEPMARRYREVWGADVSLEMIKKGRLRLHNLSNVRFLQTSGRGLDEVPNDHFDFCYSYIVFQHVPERSAIQRYISEAYRVLKRGGIMKVQVGGVYAINPFKRLYEQDRNTWDGVRFTMSEIVKVVEEANFELIAAYHPNEEQQTRTRNVEERIEEKQRLLWVVARKGRAMDPWESVCLSAAEALVNLIPEGSRVILPGAEMEPHLRAAGAVDREFIPLYPPSESSGALGLLEEMGMQSSTYLLLSKYDFWWFESYAEFSNYLNSHCKRIDETEDYIIFGRS